MHSPLPPALDLAEASSRLDRELALAFRPMHKLAFGVAVGTAAGLLVFLVTAARLLLLPPGQSHLATLANFFAGYTESWPGAVIGFAWAFVVGAVFGWFVAFVRNLLMAVWLLSLRVRAELTATRDFLDHI